LPDYRALSNGQSTRKASKRRGVNLADFAELGLSPEICAALKEQRIVEPTPIQEKAIPVVLKGEDLIAKAQTGTGKTFAFLLPILERINPKWESVQALIVTPTRELAIQITAEVEKMIHHLDGIHTLAVYGGQDVERQIKKLRGAVQIVVGTPGRLLDHVRRQTMNLSAVRMLVLDEADQMLQLGFLEEVESIVRATADDRQMLLFSATMPAAVRTLARRYMKKPANISIQTGQVALEAIRQVVVETTDRAKKDTLCHLIDEYRPFLAIIFCRTKRRAGILCESLQTQGYSADELHGDLSQNKREQVIKRFRNADIQLLVATDVAARGLDVEGVTHVFNYDIPHDAESYIHRIGRTGRAGEKGLAVTLVAPKDKPELAMIEKAIHQSIAKQGNPLSHEKTQASDREKSGGARESRRDRGSKGAQSSRNIKGARGTRNASGTRSAGSTRGGRAESVKGTVSGEQTRSRKGARIESSVRGSGHGQHRNSSRVSSKTSPKATRHQSSASGTRKRDR
jgi:ATP-dependent RNA helicase DeaD